ncbi:MAG TPA: HAMP domain-containing sensor histidine kinase [Acidimicrobiales bacterium]|nr:HAMP domain-containing sensor histidine kinase [Acidimicrobiales bacterium]
MSAPRRRVDSPARQVRTQVRRVALGATLLALALYLLACFVADLIVVDRLNHEVDSRLAARLHQVIPTLPREGPAGTLGSYSPQSSGDFDDAPVVLWWVPAHAEHAVRLDRNSPVLPTDALHAGQPTDANVGGREFRFAGAALADGRLVAGTNADQVRTARSSLLVIEAILGPLALAILYGAASVIGRSAAAPVERARRRQLEFTADASHELRTPLSVIEAEVGLALNVRRSAPEYRHALEQIAAESKRLRHIVEDLLWLARLDSLPNAPPTEAVDVASVVNVCADRFRAIGDRRGIRVTVTEKGAVPPIVFAPAEWLDRLVSVLLDNACRYANDKGQVDVTVSANGERVVLVVDDSGPGISESDRQRIFQRFHRASAEPGGAGLGLSIADAVVRATGGDCTVTTAPLGGARIAVSWPRHRPEHAWTTADSGGPEEGADGLVSARLALDREAGPFEESEGKIIQK